MRSILVVGARSPWHLVLVLGCFFLGAGGATAHGAGGFEAHTHGAPALADAAVRAAPSSTLGATTSPGALPTHASHSAREGLQLVQDDDGPAEEQGEDDSGGKHDDEKDESCFSNPVVWAIGGLGAVIIGVGCGVPSCIVCGYLGLTGASTGLVASAYACIGCAACVASGGGGGGLMALGGVALAALATGAGAALVGFDENRGLDSGTTLAGLGLVGAGVVSGAALASVGLTMFAADLDEESPPQPTKRRANELPLVVTAPAPTVPY